MFVIDPPSDKPSRPLPPGLIWHYTSADGLLGILRSKCLWASDYRHLNDTQELAPGYRIARNSMEALGCLLAPKLSPLSDENLKLVRGLGCLDPGDWLERNSVYVASLSRSGNSLPQWREYGDRGQGFSVGLDAAAVVSGPASREFEIVKCVYEDKALATALVNQLTPVLNFVVNRIKAIKDYPDAKATLDDEIATTLRWANQALDRCKVDMAACFKHPDFSSEEEWRFVGGLPGLEVPKRRFRSSKFGITPYAEVRLPKHSIREIYIGPKLSFKEAEYGLKQALEEYEVEAEVKPSGITYR